MKVHEALEKLNGDYTTETLGKELGIGERKMGTVFKALGFSYNNSTKIWSFENDEALLDTDMEEHITVKNKKVPKSESKNKDVQTSTQKDKNFTDEEIRVLKILIDEHQNDYKMYSEYRIYDELSKVPINAEQVRSAFNMSKDTTERLKKYANVRRLPLQDLVELAVINLLDEYDVK